MDKRTSRYYTFIRPILKNKTVREYSTITFSIIAIVILTLFAIKPTISTILSLQRSISQERDIYNQLLTKEKNIALGKQNYDAIPTSTLNTVNNLLPDQTDITTATNELTGIALANQASISALQYQPIDLVGNPPLLNPHPKLQEISFTMNLQGDYPKINTILSELNHSGRLVQIDTVNLIQGAQGILVVNINGRAFYLKN